MLFPAVLSMQNLFAVVYEDADLLLINKPAGLVCHPTKGDVFSSLISRIRLYLGPGGEPQLINRLDRETSGLVLVAKQVSAAVDCRRLWESRQVEKYYLAIVHGTVQQAAGTIHAPLGRDLESAVAIKDRVRPDGAAAETRFSLLKNFKRDGAEFSVLSVQPLTGRKHQIRIHLAHLGFPIVGDKLYGSDEQYYLDFVYSRLTEAQRSALILPYHGLHASALNFQWRSRSLAFQADPEPWFTGFLSDGCAEALRSADLIPEVGIVAGCEPGTTSQPF